MGESDSQRKIGINIDVGVGAKAEIKAEIPPQSSGRLLDALTDLIRPMSEARGLRADQIRLQREDVLIEIAKRARQRLDIEGGQFSPIPNKILVPALEKASLESADDNEMIERWAELIANAAKGNGISPHLVNILSELSSSQAELLEKIFWEGNATDEVDYKPEQKDKKYIEYVNSIVTERPIAHHPRNSLILSGAIRKIIDVNDPYESFFYFSQCVLPGPGSFYMSATISSKEFSIIDQIRDAYDDEDIRVDISVLSNLSLIEKQIIAFDSKDSTILCSIELYRISSFGYYFLRKCSRNIREFLEDLARSEDEPL
ncbi:Abi-alpha family protein [Mesorhizobium sp. LMG17149]|uniref:Abi-alpha family protein n=1 Tax=Mesorhizobium sp. LMG17149 TaxID=2968497 RepID=UPI00211818C7|nr:Abi-alpha family protein [Mesorhizobium sp. LMG17149]MCQ8872955.1 Abi-alpha family protein [Mesorhizobium sp. LMG17149]